jgi:hypothetical protein
MTGQLARPPGIETLPQSAADSDRSRDAHMKVPRAAADWRARSWWSQAGTSGIVTSADEIVSEGTPAAWSADVISVHLSMTEQPTSFSRHHSATLASWIAATR